MRTIAALAALLVGSWSGLQGQDIVVGDGFEAFPWVEYQGGDSGYPKKFYGMLVLTDSTVALHPCWNRYCEVNKKKGPFKIPPYFSIRLADLKEVSNSSRVRGPELATRLTRAS